MPYSRAKIRLMSQIDAAAFVSLLNSDGTADKYVLETSEGDFKVNARSLMGVLYFTTEHNEDTYLVNCTQDGVYPSGIDNFRY